MYFTPIISPVSDLPLRLHFLVFLSALGGFLFGYDTGVISGAMVLIRTEWRLSNLWQEMIVSSTILSACLTALLGGVLVDKVGRRPTILLASLLFLLGSVAMAVSPGCVVLLLGRLVVGGGVGLASNTVPLYMSECSTVDMRGLLVTIYQLAITAGMLVAGLVCGGLSNLNDGWRYMLGIAAFPASVLLLGFIAMPESPRYLISCGRVSEAEEVLRSIRSPHHKLQDELVSMLTSNQPSTRSPPGSAWLKMMKTPHARMSLLLGCLLQSTQQLSGINTVMYYSASIMVMAGVSNNSSIWLASLTSAVNFIFSIIGVLVVSKFSRRTLLFFSLMMVVTALLIISLSFHYISLHPASSIGPALALCSMCFYLVGFAPGLGPLPWAINSEMHPAWCRAEAVSLATASNWIINFLVSVTFLSLVELLGRPVTFLTYAVLTSLGSGVLFCYLPETKGVALEDMEHLFIYNECKEKLGNEDECPILGGMEDD